VSAAPKGAVVRIYYDGAAVHVGEALQTPTGRTYLVLERRLQVRGKHVGRQHLRCVVGAELESGTKVLKLRWYKRASGTKSILG
jgi:predicted transcriptional regulator